MNTITLRDLLPNENHWDVQAKVDLISNLATNFGMFLFPLCGVLNQQGTCGRKGEELDNAGKHPMPGVSMFDATDNAKPLATYAEAEPFCNFGINAEKSKLFFIDIDPKHNGHKSWAAFCERHDLPEFATTKVRTGRTSDGLFGQHIYFRYDGPESFIGDLSSYGLNGVDIKRKGYVVAPSSMHKSGFTYEFESGCAPWEIGIAELPLELLSLLRKTGDLKREISGNEVDLLPVSLESLAKLGGESTRYGKAALDGESERVRMAPEGSRNKTLFVAGARLASLVAGGELGYEEMHSTLTNAAYLCGLSDGEIANVLTRTGGAYDRGAMQPSTAPQLPLGVIEWAARSNAETPADIDARLNQFLERANVQSMDYILGDHEPEKWIVPGFLCFGRGHALLSSSGLGKSLLIRELVAKLTTGAGFWGSDPNVKLRVLYLDYENDPVYDIGASLKSMQLTDPSAFGDRLTVMSYPVFGHFDTPEGAADLELAIDYFEPDLVVIDTLSRVVEGDENSNDTWLNFYRSSGMVFKRRNLAYVRIDHVGKDATRGARGGSAKTGDIDLIWTLEATDDSGSQFKLTNSKSRVFLGKKVIHIQRESSPLSHSIVDSAEIDWQKLMDKADGFAKALEFIKALHDSGTLRGQKLTWTTHKKALTNLGITKATSDSAHKHFMESIDSD
jgi:hypothetical protein